MSRPAIEARRGVLAGLLLVTLFALPALSPLWGLSLPQSYDSLHRLHRLIEFDRAVRHGVLFPRWAPDLVYGYGYPVFNFFPYADYYLPELLHLLGLPFSQALAAAFLLYTLLAGWSMYLLTRDLWGETPALLAAVVYVYAPYQLHNSLVRGNLPEQLGLALFPLALWAFRRLIHRQQRRWLVASAVLYAAFLLSHTALDLMLTPALLLYLVIERPARLKRLSGPNFPGGNDCPTSERQTESEQGNKSPSCNPLRRAGGRHEAAPAENLPPKGLKRPILAVLLGSGLAAFFLLPAFFEKGWVRIGQDAGQIAGLSSQFLSWQQLLGPPPPALDRLLHRPDYFGLGWASLALALPALFGWKRQPVNLRPWLALTVGLLLLSVWLTLPVSAWLWERLPLLSYLLFPWRFLSLAVLALALLAGATFSLLPAGRWRPAATPLGLAAAVLAALPLLYPHYYPPNLISQNVADALAFESRTGLLGATSYGEYMPIWVQETPTGSPLLPAYQTGGPLAAIERFDATSLPPGGRLLQARYGFNCLELTLSSPQPFQARFYTFYFPGWKATVNGRPTDLEPAGPLGLIGLSLPAGESRLRLWFGDTPWRTAGKAISLTSAALLLILVLRRNLWPSPPAVEPPPGASWTARQVLWLALLALGLLAFKLAFVDRRDSFFRRQGFDGRRVEEAGHALDVPWGDQVTLLGYDLSADVLRPGDEARLTLYWQQRQRLTRRPRLVITLLDPVGGRALPQTAGWLPNDYPLEFWELDWYARDVHRLVVPADALPGRYLLTLALSDEASGDAIGSPVALTAIKAPLPPPNARPEQPLDATLDGKIALTGYDLTAGDSLRLTLYWRCLAVPGDDYTVFVHLLDAHDTIVAQADSQPRGGTYPTSTWTPGEVVPDEHALLVADLPPGDYRLAVGLYQLATRERLSMTDAGGRHLPDDRLLLPVKLP